MSNGLLSKITALFSLSDEQAMRRVQSEDDASAFAQLVSRWQPAIRNLCGRMTGDSHRGEDIAQEVFIRLYAKRKEYQSSAKFSTYLWRIALNLCYDELRRTQRRGEIFLPEASETIIELDRYVNAEAEPSVALQTRERAETVRKALLELPEIYRTVLVLRHYEDLKFREIAEVLEIPEGTVKSRMAEGMTQLAQLLKPALEEKPQRKAQGAPL